MVINCIQCNMDYRLDGESLQEAKKGMQVRCRKCGCTFDVVILPAFLRKDEETHQLNFQFAKGPSN